MQQKSVRSEHKKESEMRILRLKTDIQAKNNIHKSKSTMKLEAEITIKEDISNIKKLLDTEQKHTNNQRSSFKIQQTKEKLSILAVADDSVALRATLNTITKILTIYEKTKDVIK